MANIKTCSDNHHAVAYQSVECPVCLLREQMDELVDAKEDIDQADIFSLFDLSKDLQRRVKRIERRLGMSKKRWRRSNNVSGTSAVQRVEADF